MCNRSSDQKESLELEDKALMCSFPQKLYGFKNAKKLFLKLFIQTAN